jgi:hypothetical protein
VYQADNLRRVLHPIVILEWNLDLQLDSRARFQALLEVKIRPARTEVSEAPDLIEVSSILVLAFDRKVPANLESPPASAFFYTIAFRHE